MTLCLPQSSLLVTGTIEYVATMHGDCMRYTVSGVALQEVHTVQKLLGVFSLLINIHTLHVNAGFTQFIGMVQFYGGK